MCRFDSFGCLSITIPFFKFKIIYNVFLYSLPLVGLLHLGIFTGAFPFQYRCIFAFNYGISLFFFTVCLLYCVQSLHLFSIQDNLQCIFVYFAFALWFVCFIWVSLLGPLHFNMDVFVLFNYGVCLFCLYCLFALLGSINFQPGFIFNF